MILRTKVEKVRVETTSGWKVIATDQGMVKGVVLFPIAAGDILELEGSWKKSDYTGADEFSFKTAKLDIPTDTKGLLEYAVSITKGLGKAAEDAIWARYGEKWQEAERLDLKGIREESQFFWGETLKRIKSQQGQSQAIAFLLTHGVTLNWALAAWKAWEEKTMSIVQTNPFKLADLPRYGFIMVDGGVRQAFGVADDDPRRVKAAILYSLESLTESGSTVAEFSRFEQELAKNCPDAMPTASEAIKDLSEEGRIKWPELGLIALAPDERNELSIYSRFGGDNGI